MTISAVIIAKNEEVLLAQCLDSLKGVDEIVLVDTGSKDRTVEIAKQYTDKIYYQEWHDSFCDARNYAKSKATGDWILSIDADEILHDYSKVREAALLADKKGVLAVDCEMVASDNGQVFYFPRLFKNSPQVWWVGNIHNHLSVPGDVVGQGGKVRITHGYSPAHQLDPDRAFRILKKEVDTRGSDAVREMFYLGREYFYRNDYENTVLTLGKYVQLSRYLAEKAEAFLIMAKAYWKMRMPDDAKDACVQAIICNAHFKEALVLMAELAGLGTGHPRWEANGKQWMHMAETATNEDVLFIREPV